MNITFKPKRVIAPSELAYIYHQGLRDFVPSVNRFYRRPWNKESLALYTAIVMLRQMGYIEFALSQTKVLLLKQILLRRTQEEWVNEGLEKRILKALSIQGEIRVQRLGEFLFSSEGVEPYRRIQSLIEEELIRQRIIRVHVTPRKVFGPKIEVKYEEDSVNVLSSHFSWLQSALRDFRTAQPDLAKALAVAVHHSLKGPKTRSLFDA